jgi:predicted transport protein
MLAQESRGEVYLVTRYRRSFLSRLSQSQGNVQDYYSAIKNALLSYKGVKSRVSQNYDAFNRGRAHLAKINAKTRTLYLYLALNPEELADTKYGIVDVSQKKKYASVPVLMKIKGERKFKYALELIDKLCAENFQLPKMETEETDYRIPYQSTEELVQAGLIRKLVASVPVTPVAEEETPADAPAEKNAEEENDVTFIAPTTSAAVEAAAAEIAESPAEEVPANTESDDGNTPKEV